MTREDFIELMIADGFSRGFAEKQYDEFPNTKQLTPELVKLVNQLYKGTAPLFEVSVNP